MQGEGAKGAIFSSTPAQGGPANTNLQGDKKFVDGAGGIIVVHRGPKGIIGPGPPYFTELAWGLGCASNSPTGEVIGALFRSLAIGIRTTRTTDK